MATLLAKAAAETRLNIFIRVISKFQVAVDRHEQFS
jgi:hypothetical protein